MKVKLMLDNKKYDNKPTDIGRIVNQIKPVEIEIEELAISLCNGMTCRPGILKGTHKEDWLQQQIFCLDFDHNVTINGILQKANELEIIPVFAYTSFSHTEEHHRFRLVYVTDEVITDREKRNKLQYTLMDLFGNVDESTATEEKLFFGGKGKEPIVANYDVTINADDIINRFYKDDYSVKQVSKPIKKKTSFTAKVTTINTDYMQNIEAIKSRNADKLRGLIDGVLVGGNKEDINNLLLSTHRKTPHTFKSEIDLYNYINSIDLGEYLGIGNQTVNCILPDHEDNSPSAHIYTTDDGTQIYKCFGCGKARTIISITEELAQCKRSEAIEFIKEVYNIELMQSDWILKQKQLLIDSANYLDTIEFKTTFPELNKIIRTRKMHIQKMLIHMTQYVNEDLQINGKPLFYASYNTLMQVCEIKGKSDKLSQSLTLFALLNMLDKVELNCIPEEELKKAKSISAKYGFKKLTSFYQFQEYGFMQLKDSEERAKLLIDNNFSLKGLSREYILRTFGVALADKVYPQYKFENARGTSNKSNKATMRFSKKVLEKIEKQGFILEKDIRGKGQTETQWKRSIQEILDSYGLQRVRLNKELKEKFGIAGNGYPFLICKSDN